MSEYDLLVKAIKKQRDIEVSTKQIPNNHSNQRYPPYYQFPNSRAEQYVKYLISVFEITGNDEIYLPFILISKGLKWSLSPRAIRKIKNQLKYVPYIKKRTD